MESIVLYIITLFFILGAIDYVLGNKFSIGEEFESGMCEYFENQGKGKFNSKNVEAFEAGYDYE